MFNVKIPSYLDMFNVKIPSYLGVVAATLLMAGAAHAFPTGTYVLGNHPDGGERDPLYGFRLDGLLDGNSGSVYTFDFENNGAAMFMDYDGNMIHIHGSAWGGLDTGSSYDGMDDNAPRLWNIDFTYDTGLVDYGAGIDVMSLMENSGTITSNLGTWNLDDYNDQGPNGHSFHLGTDHRGHAGLSGWGWVNHCQGNQACEQHIYASDWLFTADLVPEDVGSVPEPAPLALLVSGITLIGFKRRK